MQEQPFDADMSAAFLDDLSKVPPVASRTGEIQEREAQTYDEIVEVLRKYQPPGAMTRWRRIGKTIRIETFLPPPDEAG